MQKDILGIIDNLMDPSKHNIPYMIKDIIFKNIKPYFTLPSKGALYGDVPQK